VIVPTCNRSARVRQCLRAVANQGFRDFEVIVVDDGSTDDTPSILRRLAAQLADTKLSVLRNETTLGANPARLRGVEACRGEILVFLDDDCIPRPEWLERLLVPLIDPDVAAATGMVLDPEPRNVFELAFKGTHRVGRPGPAGRIVMGNLAVRRAPFLECGLDLDRATVARDREGKVDLTVSGRGDEEGLYLRLRARGHRVHAAPAAVVLHEASHTATTFFRQAWRGGRSAARLVYKYHLPPRLDCTLWTLAWLSLALPFLHRDLAWGTAVLFGLALAAITWNDLFRKGKTLRETLRSFPALLAWYQVRTLAYLVESLRLRIFPSDIVRERLSRPAG
jgi:GT2 family glycosyltransferase